MEDVTNIIPPSPADPSLDDSASTAPAVARELLLAVPAGPQVTQDELVAQLAESRIRIVRIGGIPLETIGTIAAAIFIEAAFFTAGYLLVINGVHWLGHPDPDGLQRTVFSVDFIDDGGNGTGGAPKGKAPRLGDPELAGDAPIAALGKLPHPDAIPLLIPALSGSSDAPPASAIPDEPPLVAFGLASAPDAPKTKLPRLGLTPATSPADGPRIDQANGPVASAAGNAARAVAASLGAGNGGDDADYVIPGFIKPGKGGGVGTGSGSGRGDGSDRGPSIANHDAPAVLYAPRFDLPEHIRRGFVPIKGGVAFLVTVEPDGKPSAIKLIRSCGSDEVDALAKANIAGTKFRPAYRAGHPVTATMDMSFFDGVER